MANELILVYTIIYGIITCTSLGLFVWCYFVQPFWKSGDDSTKSARRILFACVLIYLICIIVTQIALVTFLISGWKSAEFVSFFVQIFYALSLFLMIYVWIQRLETTFSNSIYEVNGKFLKFLKYSFLTIIISGIIILGLLISSGGTDQENSIIIYLAWFFMAVFTITFFVLLITLIATFVTKLNQLINIAKDRLILATNAGNYDIEPMIVIQKLVKLQLKLTIVASVAIVSSFIAMPFSIFFDQEYELLAYGVDVAIGFYCVHCTVNMNDGHYQILCKLCICACDSCFKTTKLDENMKVHVSSHSNITTGRDDDVALPINCDDNDNDKTDETNTTNSLVSSQNITVLSTKLEPRTTNDHIELNESTPQITNDPSGTFFD